MRRVAVTGLGAVTPLGNDAPSTWRAAVAGESGIDFIKSFDASEFPVRVAAEVKDFDPTGLVIAEGGAAARPQRPARARRAVEAKDDAGLNGFDPARVGVVFGSAIGGFLGIMEQSEVLRRARARPRLAVLHPERARRLGERPDRDLARPARPELRAGLRLRDRLARRRRGGRAHQAGRRRRRPRRRHRGLHAPADPGRLLRDARARRGGGAPAARLAPLRRHARRLRDGRRRLRSRPRGPGRGRERGAKIYAEVLGYGASNDAYHMAAPDPASVGVAEMMRAALARAGREPERRRLRQRPRHVDPAGRPGGDEGAQGRLWRPRLRAGRLVDEVDDGPLLRGRRRDRGDDVRARDPRGRRSRRRSTTSTPTPNATSTTSRTRRARPRSTWRSRTRWASAATTVASCSAASTGSLRAAWPSSSTSRSRSTRPSTRRRAARPVRAARGRDTGEDDRAADDGRADRRRLPRPRSSG